MSLRRRTLKGGAVLTAGQGLGQMLSFVRNVIVARLLSPEDVGIGATFWVTIALLQMISDLSADKLIIQAHDGDEPRLQATAQLWQALRGVCNAVVLFSLAWPVARLFRAPHALWAFQCMALVPLIRGLLHLDLKRRQREMRYGPQVGAELTAQSIAAVAAWPICVWLQDYSAVVVLALLQEVAALAGSHLVARRRYRWAWDRDYARRLLSFGWPLLVNGLLMFGAMQGDRLIVGTVYSLRDLGVYSIAFALAMAPAAVAGSVSSSLLLPLLSEAQEAPKEFRRRYVLCSQGLAALAVLFGAACIVPARQLLVLAFGPVYAAGAGVFGALVCMQAVRLLRLVPTLAALARGDSQNAMYANLCRSLALPAVAVVAWQRFDLLWVPLLGFVGEAVAFLVSALRLRMHHEVPLSDSLPPFGALLGALAIAGTVAWISAASEISAIGLFSAVVGFLAGALLVMFGELRSLARNTSAVVWRRITAPAT